MKLTAITPLIKAPRTNEAFRVDQVAAMLQANLYMNAKVYTGTEQYTKALPLITKKSRDQHIDCIMNYKLFLADNDKNGAQNEFIFAIALIYVRKLIGTTFLTHAPVGGV
jgi:hypothetical protein